MSTIRYPNKWRRGYTHQYLGTAYEKKEYPINGLEQDCISHKARRIVAYVVNTPGIKSFAKNQINRRRRYKTREVVREELLYHKFWYLREDEYCEDCEDEQDYINRKITAHRESLWMRAQNLTLSGKINRDRFDRLVEMIFSVIDESDFEFLHTIFETLEGEGFAQQ